MRRLARRLPVLLCAALACAAQALAQPFPSKPIRLVVAYPPGGAADLVARIVQPRMRELLGQPGVIENRAGAGGQVGAQLVVLAPADGHTVLFTVGPAHLLARFTAKSLPYDPVKDFAPVTSAVSSVLCIAAHPAFPPNSVAELIAYAKANPGKVSFGTTAVGGESHLSMEFVKSLAAIDMTHVPYKGGGPATTDLLGNHIPLLVLPLSTVMEHVNKGSAKVVGVIFPRRFPGLPQVATVTETLPGFRSLGSWIGVFAPAGVPAATAARLQGAIAQALNAPEVRDKLEAVGQFVVANPPAELAAQIDRAMELYATLAKKAGIRPE